MVGLEEVLVTVDQQRELALEDDIDLLLALVGVDSGPLPWLKHHQVHPEGMHSQLASQPLETLATLTLKNGERDVGLGHRTSIARECGKSIPSG
jgi:hypothetical protein